MSVDLSEIGVATGIAKRLKLETDEYCANVYDDGPRSHLGASLIGRECKRYLWFSFRWVHHHKFSGRMQRLFNRGHKEEARFIEWLRGIGCTVWEFNKCLWYHQEANHYMIGDWDMQIRLVENDELLQFEDVTNEPAHVEAAKRQGVVFEKGKAQFRISGVMGHFGGSTDGMLQLPLSYGIEEKLLSEFKTSGDSAFTKLAKNGVKIEKEEHFCQMSVYGYKLGLRYAVYESINKNNDEIHLEIIKLDWDLGKRLEEKAHNIITSECAPERMSNNSSHFKCKQCDMREVCFNGQPLAVNCRSCCAAMPVENAQWFCRQYQQIIPKEYIPKACQLWKGVY